MSALSVRQMAALTRKLEKHRDAVGVERDKLRAIVDEYDALADTCDRAWHDLQSAIDTLSEHA